MPANYNTIPGNISMLPRQFVRRNAADTAWEAYDTASAQDLATKADLVGGKVPASQLPAAVDEIEEHPSVNDFPATGDSNRLYLALDTNLIYRWTGSVYGEVSQSLALGETSSTAYRGDRGKTAYDHSQLTSGNPHNVTKSNVGLGNVDNTSDANKPVSTAQQTALDAKYNIPAGSISQYVRGDGSLATFPVVPARSFASASRALNSAFQIDTSRDAAVSYAVDIAATLTLSGGATGTVILEYANDASFSAGVTTVNSTANGNTGTLTIGLALTQTATATLSGIIPAGKYVRLRTANTAGTPSFTYRTGQEVLL